jgi:hypothetical protein
METLLIDLGPDFTLFYNKQWTFFLDIERAIWDYWTRLWINA